MGILSHKKYLKYAQNSVSWKALFSRRSDRDDSLLISIHDFGFQICQDVTAFHSMPLHPLPTLI
jgi:hypothetical protein